VRLRAAFEPTGHGDARVELVQISSPDEAAEARFAGSPTLLVEGRDLFPARRRSRNWPAGCTRPHGLSGSPTFEALVVALSDRSPSDAVSATSIAP
jgi:hypothetical protein